VQFEFNVLSNKLSVKFIVFYAHYDRVW
jgi:hypothetical protein